MPETKPKESSKSKVEPRRIEPGPGSNLSIDGFGVHSFIPLKILAKLEEYLQKEDGKAARITDYFDVISSTGTGAIIAAMLTAQSEEQCLPPKVSEITEFMKGLFEKIEEAMSKKKSRSHSEQKPHTQFSDSEAEQSQEDSDSKATQPKPNRGSDDKSKTGWDPRRWVAGIKKILRFFLVEHKEEVDRTIKKEIEDWFIEAKLRTTYSKLVIPVHDLDNGRPFLLSSALAERLKEDHYADINLSEVVLASLSTLFTAQNHQAIDIGGKKRNFLEGGYATTNPTLLAVQEGEMVYERDDCEKFLVLSLGTAERKAPDDIWSIWSWFLALVWKSQPLLHWVVEVQQYVYGMLNEIVEIYMSQLFYSKEEKMVTNNYLRIKDFDLDEGITMPAMVDVTKIDRLEEIGARILQKEVVQVNPITGTPDKLTQVQAEAARKKQGLNQSDTTPQKKSDSQVHEQSEKTPEKSNSQAPETKKFTSNEASLKAFAKELVKERTERKAKSRSREIGQESNAKSASSS